ncbi:hypothetical protein [Verrucomicrobium sp. BvORR106]|uniref:hypothetical protein n=1 Tax=Verrucomicrobium sp. BvORR106 TaxID=1403819 RepID=UPI002241022C|nr:hypothetical protein [Verrucomicrobium sp. BvORR106]
MNSVDHSISRLRQAHGPARRMMMIAWFSVSACLCVPGIVPFIPDMGGTACAAAPDFGKGFDLLFELGLQELPVDRWEYREIEGVGSRQILPNSGEDKIRAVVTELEKTYTRGWADKTTGEPGKPELLVWDGWQIHNSTQLVHSWGEPKRISLLPADERADAQALAKGLQAIATSKPVRENLLYSSDTIVSFFFRAAQYHRRGYRAEAEAAAQALFAIVPRQDRLLDLAVQTLAGQQYQKALDKFSGTRDWQALNTDLQRLLQTYSRGWAVRPLIEKLQQSVQKRLSSPQVPALAQASFLTPEQQAWWASVTEGQPPKKQGATEQELEEYPQGMDYLGKQWLAGVRMAANPEGFSDLETQKESLPTWQRAVLDKDWDWISVIAAGLGDDVLVGQRLPSYDPYEAGFDFSTDPPELTEEEIDEKWPHFYRPQTRGELARDFIESIVPFREEEGGELPTDLAELRDLALKTAKDVHGKSPVEVAKYYLKVVNDEQKSHALSGIIRNGNNADLDSVANLMLENPLQYFEHFTELVQRQKSAAQPALAQFRNTLLEQLAPALDKDPNVKPGELPEPFQHRLKNLEALAAGRTIGSVIEDYVNRKIPDLKLSQELRTAVVSVKDKELLPDLGLEAVTRLQKGDGTRKWNLIQTTIKYPLELTDARRQALLQIIQEDGNAPVIHENGGSRPLADQIYWLANLFEDYGRRNFVAEVYRFDPEDLWPLWIEHGKASLEGRPLPPLPSAGDVPAPRLQEILQAIPGLTERGWPEYLRTLSLAEKLALQKELRQSGVPPEWRPLALRVTKVTGSSPELEKWAPLQSALGKPLDGALMASLAEVTRTRTLQQEGQEIGVTLHLSPLPLLQGWQIEVETYSPTDLDRPNLNLPRTMEWIQKFEGQFGSPPGIQGCAWLRWPQNHRDQTLFHWHLDADRRWQNWTSAEYPGLGGPAQDGNVIPETQMSAALDERLRNWNPTELNFWMEASAFKPAAREPKDTKSEEQP